VTTLVGLFSKTPKDNELKNNIKKFKEFKTLLQAKKYDESLKAGIELLKKVPDHHDALFMVGGIYYLKNNQNAVRNLARPFRCNDAFLQTHLQFCSV